ncbi:protein of unknown function [endosymbiont DhMRE of Dentiscutata heterogama]|uniref:hypothetical protein n=1 Tax=endosymbiont DhMRE of Dentiscutata heterogama TaxID=1609546 RepID=UPI000629D6C5|nr:hypothetical protein [endosymbiont DhMRE of Dentiscutata heterogama]CFW93103.1 protein of unknown function [endosymbiont DhMRE of Dentiscutata heterogama]
MNKINDTYQCVQCKRDFSAQDVYRIGIKNKQFFCRECAKNIKSECMWCSKELEKKEWKRIHGYEIKSEEGKLAETIDYDEREGEKHHKYYLICPEELHGKDWIKCCQGQFNRWWVDKNNQKYQNRKDQGWKNCAGKGVYHRDPKTGKEIFNLDCYKLVPPGQKYCGDDSCIYYTAVYNDTDSEEKKKIRQKWDQRNQEKYRRANEWWNSLSLAEKGAKLKKEEEHLESLGLQRQKCWLERLDQNSILFENGKIYYDNMDKIPPSFLHEWGYPGYHWESVWKNDNNNPHALQAKVEIEKEIGKKESLLEQAKIDGDNEAAAKLEQQLQELKNQQKNNSTTENPNENKIITYSIIGLSLMTFIGLIIILAKSRKKNPKIK